MIPPPELPGDPVATPRAAAYAKSLARIQGVARVLRTPEAGGVVRR